MPTEQKKKSLFSKLVKGIILMGIITFGYFSYVLFLPNIFTKTSEATFLLIPTGSTYDQAIKNLSETAKVSNLLNVRLTAKLLKYKNIIPGRYKITSRMSNFSLIRLLRSGKQTPVRLIFNNIRTKNELAGRFGKELMTDSTQFMMLLDNEKLLAEYGFTPSTITAMFIPDTYEIFWNTNPKDFLDKMFKAYNRFWNDERKMKATSIPLTPTEVTTLASIVEEETKDKSDKPIVAGLYINRLKNDMPLQADPTVKFAIGNFALKRITIKEILFISPYNTYRNHGLPPGPICIPSKNSIDAVLNYTHHDYIYMCASENLDGKHKFAANWNEHQANAKAYQAKLNELNIH